METLASVRGADLRLAGRLRDLRQAKRWSFDELAARSGVSRASLSRIEKGEVSPPAPGFDCELLECELPAGSEIDYPLPPRPGLEHHLYLQAGALELPVDETVYRSGAGDCLRYRLNGASRFRVLGRRPARYVLVVR